MVLVLGVSGSVSAQFQPVKILSLKIGLPAGRFTAERDERTGEGLGLVKNNTWAPVYAQLEIQREERRPCALVIESTDPDDLGNAYAVPLQNLAELTPGSRIEPTELRALPYVRPSGRGEIVATVRVLGQGNPAEWRAVSEPFRINYLRTREVSKYVILSLGSKLPGFELPKEAVENEAENARALRNGRIETAAITDLGLLPDKWYGYDAADLVVLSTGSISLENFLVPLFTQPAHQVRLNAFLEWVRRGGRVVVSVGSNAQTVAGLATLQELLPVKIAVDNPAEQVKSLVLEWELTSSSKRIGTLSGGTTTFPVANVVGKPDRGARQLMPPRIDAAARPLILQSAFGMGRVTLVTFDLDRSPFVSFPQRNIFWDLLLKETGSPRSSVGSTTQVAAGTYRSPDSEDEYAMSLRATTDTFAGVPVISFGWVAAFIVFYALLIGPIEYYLLKKVFKRLELTWITFPIIVLSVSAIAYFTAYAIKGKDLKVNKVDLVDVDLGSNRLYGKSWFTIFSPRIENYRIGIEPNDGWSGPTEDSPAATSLVDWVGGTRNSKTGFFRRSYYYQTTPPGSPNRVPYADGLVDVPVQVWSTKAFSAEWSAPLSSTSPLIVANVNHPPANAKSVAGTVTLNLPIAELLDCHIIYAGKAYAYDAPITPGTVVNVLLSKDDPTWLEKFNGASMMARTSSQRQFGGTNTPSSQIPSSVMLFSMLFHDEIQKTNDTVAPNNATLRRFDQSWRLSDANRDELIIVGRVPPTGDQQAEALTSESGSPSPTKLWLRDLPSSGKPRDAQSGTMQQETYVRIFIPLRPVAAR